MTTRRRSGPRALPTSSDQAPVSMTDRRPEYSVGQEIADKYVEMYVRVTGSFNKININPTLDQVESVMRLIANSRMGVIFEPNGPPVTPDELGAMEDGRSTGPVPAPEPGTPPEPADE